MLCVRRLCLCLVTLCLVAHLASGQESSSEGIEVNTSEEDVDGESSPSSTLLKFSTPSTLGKNSTSEDVEEDEDEESVCDGRLSSFIRNFDPKPFLPSDYDEIEEKMPSMDLHNYQAHHLNDTIRLVERLINYGQKLMNNTDLRDTSLYLSSVMMDKLYRAEISEQCTADLLRVVGAMRSRNLWAFKFPDSWATVFPSGLLRGHISSFGEYDQCISIKSPDLGKGRHIYGKYCQVHFRSIFPHRNNYQDSFEQILRSHPYFPKIVELAKQRNMDNYLGGKLVYQVIEGTTALRHNLGHYGVCFPHTCSPIDIEKVFHALFYPITKIPVRVEEELCTPHKDLQKVTLDTQQLTAICALLVLGTIVLFASAYQLYLTHWVDVGKEEMDKASLISTCDSNNNGNGQHSWVEQRKSSVITLSTNLQTNSIESKPKKPKRTVFQQFILAFSAVENSRRLFSIDNRFAVLDTMRFLLTFGVYSLQTFDFQTMLTLQMMRSIQDTVPFELLWHNAYWFARAPGFFIDGFVFNLGVMLIMSQFSRLKKTSGHFSFLIYMWKRWYRLSIAMVGTFFVLFIFPLTGDGPLWFINTRWLMPACKDSSSIVSSFLYYSNWNPTINNYTISSKFPICNPPTWFLSMSTQLYVFAPLIFLPLYRYPRFGVYLTVAVLAISPLFTISPTMLFNSHTYYEATKFETVASVIRGFLLYHISPAQYVSSLMIGMLTGFLIKTKPNLRVPGGRFVEFLLWVASFGSIVAAYLWNNSLWDLNKVNNELEVLSWFVYSKIVAMSGLGFIAYMCCTGKGGVVNRIFSISFLQPVAKLSYSIYLLRVPTIFYRVMSVRHTYEMTYWHTFQHILIDYLITTILAYGLYLLFEAPSNNIMKIFEEDEIYQIFNAKQNKPSQVEDNSNKPEVTGIRVNGHLITVTDMPAVPTHTPIASQDA